MKKYVFGVLTGILITLSVVASALFIYNAKEIEFVSKDTNWNVDNVEDAINDIKNNYIPKSTYIGEEYTFDFTGSYKSFIVPHAGLYKVELWGAAGGTGTYNALGGKGAYTTGKIHLEKDMELFIYVGGKWGLTTTEGWNGGSRGANNNGAAGGGATDVRLKGGNWNDAISLRSRIMVAGAGGGGGHNYGAVTGENSYGGNAGTLIGYSGNHSRGGTQYSYTTLAQGGTQVSGGTRGSGGLVTGNAGAFGVGGSVTGTWGELEAQATMVVEAEELLIVL